MFEYILALQTIHIGFKTKIIYGGGMYEVPNANSYTTSTPLDMKYIRICYYTK